MACTLTLFILANLAIAAPNLALLLTAPTAAGLGAALSTPTASAVAAALAGLPTAAAPCPSSSAA